MSRESVVRSLILGVSGVALLIVSIYFFLTSLKLLTSVEQNVTASLLAALIGFSLMSGGVTILRSWAIARAAEKASIEGRKE